MISPWTFGLGGALIALTVGFGVGLRLGEARLDAFHAKVDAVGAQQEARSAQRALADQQLKEKTDETHRKSLADLRQRYDERLRNVTRSSVLPAVPAVATGGSGDRSSCFDRAELARRLDGALERFRAGAEAVLFRGDAARLDASACARWAVRLVEGAKPTQP